MKSLYQYRKERHYEKPPEVIWPFVADTARINELSGSPVYQVEERADAEGRIHRFATAGLGPLRLRWEDGYSEWQENRRIVQVRDFQNGPMRRFQAAVELYPEGTGSRLVYSSDIELVGILGWLAKQSGQIDREGDKRLAVVEKLIAEAEAHHRIPGSSDEPAVKPTARRRLETLIAELARDPASHGLAQKLSDFLLHAPVVALRGIHARAGAR
jgi:carbon monoxide dehydrogenase subunit G